MNTTEKYTIGRLAEETGLSTVLIRAWEKRYSIVKPERTDSNRRIYSSDDYQKLLKIKFLIKTGYKIGSLARLNDSEFNNLYELKKHENSHFDAIDLKPTIKAIYNFDNLSLKNIFNQYLVKLSKREFITHYILPLLNQIGDKWQSGKMKISNEHFASSLIYSTLMQLIEIDDEEQLPVVVICTPNNQEHELMALAIAVLVSTQGYRVVYIGSSVPAEEISGVLLMTSAIALILSIVYPADDNSLVRQLEMIEEYIDNDTVLIAGGKAAEKYLRKLDKSRFTYTNDIDQLFEILDKQRNLNS